MQRLWSGRALDEPPPAFHAAAAGATQVEIVRRVTNGKCIIMKHYGPRIPPALMIFVNRFLLVDDFFLILICHHVRESVMNFR